MPRDVAAAGYRLCRGFNLLAKCNGRNNRFTGEQFEWIAEPGFNFVRLAARQSRFVEAGGMGLGRWNFSGGFCILDSGRADVKYEDWRGHKLDKAMLELLQEFNS